MGAGPRRAYLPAGSWTDWWTGEVQAGPRWITVEAPIDRVPLWIREGGIVPLGPVQQHVGERTIDDLEVRVGRFRGEGPRLASLAADLGERGAQIDYVLSDGRHTVTVAVDGGPSHRVELAGDVGSAHVSLA